MTGTLKISGNSTMGIGLFNPVGDTNNQVLTNKTLTDNSTFFQNNIDNTKKLQFQLSDITTSTTRTLTVPNVNITIVGTDAVQTLTNKTIDSDTNTVQANKIRNVSIANTTATADQVFKTSDPSNASWIDYSLDNLQDADISASVLISTYLQYQTSNIKWHANRLNYPIRTKTTNYSLLPDDITICCNGASALSMILPVNVLIGYFYIFVDISGNAATNNITISTYDSKNIDGSSTYVINTNYGTVTICANGTNWSII